MALSKFINAIFTVVTDEELSSSVTSSDFPTERESVTDNITNNPDVLSISGVILGENAVKTDKLIRTYMRNGEIGTYVGRFYLSGCIIEDYTTANNKDIGNGFEFTMTLKKINIAKKQTVVIDQSIVNKARIKMMSSKGKQGKSKANANDKAAKSVKSVVEGFGSAARTITIN